MKKTLKKHGGKRKNAGRKPSENAKSIMLTIRTTPEKREKLREIARKAGQSVTGLIEATFGLEKSS